MPLDVYVCVGCYPVEMKYYSIIFLVPLCGCTGFLDAAGDVIADPAVQAKVGGIVSDATADNWVGALWGAAGLVTLLFGKKGFDWTKGRLLNSGEGEILGGKPT